ncbi:MAG: M28 family peptidase [Prevotellaceae bacterium]|jgi:Zn-dependent M28 family amino/carboxypeptidase|nr:M28 family peptidase [Prevotellaceae bacterium]
MKAYYLLLSLGGLILFAASCKTNANRTLPVSDAALYVPTFDADSAYHYVEAQTEFGPRVPNTEGHRACGNYLAEKLAAFGATVTNQSVDLTTYDGKTLKARNIIGSYNLQTKKRVALFAHWDTRPWADKDTDPTKHRTPVLGANDGASGVGVLLEIARQIQRSAPTIGIDIIFFDAEDGGVPEFEQNYPHSEEAWCLGSQYWARNPHVSGYTARFGILLDMVGAFDSHFLREWYSEQYAKNINTKVWNAARSLGYGRYFINQKGGGVTDDHLFVNKLARIPTIDIVPTPTDQNQSFFAHWHTTNDTMANIDRSTLKAVGQTVLQVIYSEK